MRYKQIVIIVIAVVVAIAVFSCFSIATGEETVYLPAIGNSSSGNNKPVDPFTATPTPTSTPTTTNTPTNTSTNTPTATVIVCHPGTGQLPEGCVTATPTATATNTHTHTLTNTPAPMATGGAGVVVQDNTSYRWVGSQPATLVIVGEIKNNRQEPIQFPETTIKLYDGEGNLAVEQVTYTLQSEILPGRAGCFRVEFDQYSIPGTGNYEVTETLYYIYGPRYLHDNELRLKDVYQPYDFYYSRVIGTVFNATNRTANNVRIIASVYSADGQLLRCLQTFPQTTSPVLGQLPQRTSAPFDITLYSWADIATEQRGEYVLQTEGE